MAVEVNWEYFASNNYDPDVVQHKFENLCRQLFTNDFLKENKIRRLNSIEAYKYLYSEMMVNTWNEEFINGISDMIMDLISKVPIYMMECLPDESAVNLLKKELNIQIMLDRPLEPKIMTYLFAKASKKRARQKLTTEEK